MGRVLGVTEQIKDQPWAVSIGAIRTRKIARQYQELGYLVISNPENHEGADVIIISLPDGRIRKVIECSNFREKKFHMDNDRVDRYIANLTYFEGIEGVELELIVTYMDNLSAGQLLDLKNHIKVTALGYQDTEEKTEQGWIDKE